ncbi:sensor histidine kinase [Tunturiibacter gelidoferens]|uniref:ATP-binding protein n=1 Tax=Tunturiibacter gelidiferens TaxID=3069689 RepID=A0AAU7Z5K1_9BACT
MNQSIEQTISTIEAVSSRDLGPLLGKVSAGPSERSFGGVLRRARRVFDDGLTILPKLRAPGCTSPTIEQSLSGFLENFSTAGARCQIWVTGKPQLLEPTILEELTLIGREALANALQHSQATLIEAEVEYSTRGLRLIVRDNGRGMARPDVRSGTDTHWGVSGMRERARRIGAQLSIWSRSGAGTEVEICIPNRFVAITWA